MTSGPMFPRPDDLEFALYLLLGVIPSPLYVTLIYWMEVTLCHW